MLYDKRMNVKIKSKIYETIIRPDMLYGAETWVSKKSQDQKMNIVENKNCAMVL